MENAWLAHHGVTGMRWGVRRYQNADGSYTKKGLEHYRKSEKKYDEKNQLYKDTKKAYKEGKASKEDVKAAKAERKQAQKDWSKNYDQLKKDYKADQGKELYRSGKTITGNAKNLAMGKYIAGGTIAVAGLLAQQGQMEYAKYALFVGAGLEAVNGILAVKNTIDDNKLRAYYTHKGEYVTEPDEGSIKVGRKGQTVKYKKRS